MTTQLIPFQFEAYAIRAVVIDGQPMFSARDVALALGYADPSQAYKAHCKSLKLLDSVNLTELKWPNPHPRGEYVMPESDVYRLIVKSEKPEAERFEQWVFEEVLPTIRKTGGYSTPNKTIYSDVMLTAMAYGVKAVELAHAFGFTGNMATLSANQLVTKATGINLLEHMGATHLLADPHGKTYTPTELGKLMTPPLSAVKFNLRLEAAGLQSKEMDCWLPRDEAEGYFEWLDTGKKHSNGTPVKQLKWFKTVMALFHSSRQLVA